MSKTRRLLAAMVALAISIPTAAVMAPATATAAAVGQGFTVTASDLAYILKQIKIAEAHVANTTSETGPCGALLGTGPNQLSSPLLSFGLRTVDGSCNNLVAGKAKIGAADELFPRLATAKFRDAEPQFIDPDGPGPVAIGDPSSYKQKATDNVVTDSEPRMVSNLIVDQTSTNPAAIAAAGFPVRTQGNPGTVPCTIEPNDLADPPTPGSPIDCTPKYHTLFIPNVTTDVGLSPPYNSMFTLFGQFFDHGVDQTVKGGGTVFVPLKGDDPLVAGKDHVFGNADDLPASQRFMVLTRAQNQPGPDGVMGTADDIQDAKNTDSPWVDQSQTYTSHASHQVFLREYANVGGKPVSTGKLLGGLDAGGTYTGSPDGRTGISTWASTKKQAANLLGLKLVDKDVLNIPMLASDPYGNFLPGPNGLPQYVTASGLVEGHLDDPATTAVDETVPVPADAKYFDTPFLTDIAHNADPSPQDTDHNPGTPPVAPTPDSNTTPSADFASQTPGTYDDEMLNAHFTCGDGRCNENIGLSTIHQVFHSEHDRLIGDVQATLDLPINATLKASYQAVSASTFDYGERLFQVARFVTEMQYQHLVFEEFARKVQPAINPFEPFAFTQPDLNPAIRAEFAHAVYRFGHSMLTETIDRKNADGSSNNISLLNGFLNPPAYFQGGSAGTLTPAQAAGSIVMGMSDQTGNELDEFVTDTLRNNLLGLPLDLATVNMTRARSEGVPALNVFRRQLFDRTNDGQLKPYISWVDFGENIKHPESLVNFVAAYGQHPSILNASDGGPATLVSRREAARKIVNPVLGDTDVPADADDFMNSTGAWLNNGTASKTGVDNVDLWVGGLAEMTTPFGGLLGTTFNYVFENQLTDLQNGDRLYYLARTPGMNLRTQLEGNSFAELIERNTDGTNTLKADVFATADCKFQLGNLTSPAVAGPGPDGIAGNADDNLLTGSTSINNDPATECNENALLLKKSDGTIQYRAINSVDPSGINGQSVYNGTDNVDRVWGGNDNDTFWGNAGNDIIEGGAGADIALGGEGDDIITDTAGDDVPKGGPGNDAIDAGIGLDIIMAGTGKDFTNGGANANETFAGAGDDFVYLGQSLDAAFGDSGDDWEEGGDQPDLMQGDSGNLFFLDDSQTPGHDILIGQGGDDDYDMEGGNDIGVGGSGIEKVAGASGYDFEIGQGEPQKQDMDLALPIAPLDILTAGVRDKFNEVEALSGWTSDDTLRGDDLIPAEVGGAGFIGCDVLDQNGIDMIAGLDPLLPTLTTTLASVVDVSASKDCPILSGPVWGAGNVLLGGAGSDLIEGRGGDDVIDGDKYVGVRLSVRTNAADPASEIGSAGIEGSLQSAMTSQYLRDATTGALTGPTLQAAVFAGTVNPGNIVAVREILTGTEAPAAVAIDTAVFSGPQANYTVTSLPAADGNEPALTVTDTTGTDGTDTLRNIERLQFTDGTVTLAVPAAPTNVLASNPGDGSASVSFTAPAGAFGVSSFIVQSVPTGTGAAPFVTVTDPSVPAFVSGLTNGVAYQFKVAAINQFGQGAFSALSNTVTPNETTAPTVTARVPAANATGVAVGANVSATFSEPVQGVTPANFTIRQGANPVLAGTVNQVGTTNEWALNPTADLAANTVYTVTLTGNATTGIRDAANNALATTTWTFTTAAAPDTVAPTVTARVPAAGATGVPVANDLTATFSEAVQGVAAGTFTLRQGTNPASAVLPGVVTAGPGANQFTLNPTANLTGNTVYTATLTGNATTGIRDVANNPLVTVSWTITTVAGDATAPTVTARTPAANATNVAVANNITATFSEAVNGVTGTTFVLRNTATNATIGAAVTRNGTTNQWVLNPTANLVNDTRYTVTLTGGAAAIRDAAGNPLTTTTWSFLTGPAPTITARTPAANATNVAVANNITATFSEAVNGVTGTTFVLRNTATNATIGAAVTRNGTTNQWVLNPTANLANDTRYTVTLTGGATAIRDAAGNPLTTATWSFLTGPAPTITARTPAVGATNISRTANITATFSEPLAPATISGTTANVRNTATGVIVTGVTSFNATTRVLTINPNTTLAANTQFTVTLTNGITDVAGNPIPATTWNYRTGA